MVGDRSALPNEPGGSRQRLQAGWSIQHTIASTFWNTLVILPWAGQNFAPEALAFSLHRRHILVEADAFMGGDASPHGLASCQAEQQTRGCARKQFLE